MPDVAVSREQVRFLVCDYEGSKLQRTTEVAPRPSAVGGAFWSCERRGSSDSFQVTFRLVKGAAKAAGVAVAFDFARWTPKNYVIVPAAIYNGNRLHALGDGYMPAYPRSMFFNPNLPVTMSNNPRLELKPGKSSLIELQTGNASIPAVAYYSPNQKKGFILLCEQKSRFGNNGLRIEENAVQDRISFIVSAPGVRERAAEFGGFRPSGDVGADWKAGDELTLKFKSYSFPAKGIPDLLNKLLSVRKALTGPNQPRNLVPMSKMAETIAPRFKKRWQEAPVGGYYLPENSPDFQLGWVSGFMQTPMLALGDPLERAHVERQLDFVVAKLQGKSGLFYGGITAKGLIRADRSLDGRPFVLTRKNADALVMFFKFFQILIAQGHRNEIKPEWEQSARRLAAAFESMWRKRGEFGQYLDPETGEIAVFNSTSGALFPAGLAMAGKYFNNPEYLRVAKESANFYYRRDVVGRGFTGGHCADISQDPDSESSFGFLESLMALCWATGDSGWLRKARDEAALAASWVLSYDYIFPPQSDIARLGGHMAGAVWASAQNKHAAPGICTSSGDYLFKLFRATGDRRYAELLRDIQHAQVEATDMPGHPTCHTGFGASMERIQPTDAEGKGAVGNFIQTQNAWCELDGLMMAIEIPGIYLRTDSGDLFVFDHVIAKVVKHAARGITLQLSNPTDYDAKVSVFAESRGQAKHPLGYTNYLRWPKVAVPAKSTAVVTIWTDGSVH
ncbi:hypothetical protein OP10G_4319 [Fimbriimonas ginsengisoli Gsoil 348]|uniref:Uncharacterized protein n=2 Tax=Fimbriimonas ginsengisoli TaxID=1005039 RepID=A0A068NWE8_FIMGI|nr:hypothetical protein OP10G_4319 [Fimbriimonas ginsengisoli Gsoil 348]